jgi:hypothetical protein
MTKTREPATNIDPVFRDLVPVGTPDSLAARVAGCAVGGWKRMGLDQERLPFHDMKTSSLRGHTH